MDRNRKYRQAGYQDTARDKAERKEPVGSRTPQGPRTLGAPGSRTVSRCVECGTRLVALTDSLDRCPKCGVDLRACKQCAHFDPGRRFECTQPIPERIPNKSARNDCPHFSLRVSVERETSSGTMTPDEARRGFDNLFKR